MSLCRCWCHSWHPEVTLALAGFAASVGYCNCSQSTRESLHFHSVLKDWRSYKARQSCLHDNCDIHYASLLFWLFEAAVFNNFAHLTLGKIWKTWGILWTFSELSLNASWSKIGTSLNQLTSSLLQYSIFEITDTGRTQWNVSINYHCHLYYLPPQDENLFISDLSMKKWVCTMF